MTINKFKTIDKQYNELPKKVIFCRNCVVSNQRPRTKFDNKGVCSICNWSYEKDFKIISFLEINNL